MKRLITITVASLLLAACAQTETNYPVLPLDGELYAGNKEMLLNDIAERLHVIPVETNDSALLNFMNIIGETDNKLVLYEASSFGNIGYLYTIDKTSGAVNTFVNRQGQGPREYTGIYEAYLEGDTAVSVYDIGKDAFLRYDLQGAYLGTVRKESTITQYRVLPDGNYYATHPLYDNPKYYTAVYDKDWKLLRNGLPNDRLGMDYSMMYNNNGLV
jgi:hypothetical protein